MTCDYSFFAYWVHGNHNLTLGMPRGQKRDFKPVLREIQYNPYTKYSVYDFSHAVAIVIKDDCYISHLLSQKYANILICKN